jgi:adenylate cyclase
MRGCTRNLAAQKPCVRMAVFDSADEAFQAAIEMQQRVADLPPVSGVKLAIRVGFSHGPVSEGENGIVGKTVETAAHLAGLAKPGQVLTSLQAHYALSAAFKRSTRDADSTSAPGMPPGSEVYEVMAPESLALAAKNAEAGGPQQARLVLRYAGTVINIDDKKRVILMGRDPESDVVIRDRRGSRNHAQIERRGDRIVLIDKSTNGTFLTLTGKPELFLHREECVLQGKGVISFAASATSPDADCAEFEQP